MIKGNFILAISIYIFKPIECIHIFPVKLTLIKIKRVAGHSSLDQMLIFSLCQEDG